VAAVIKQQHPTWPAWAIRSAIVNTADVDVLEKDTLDGLATDVNVIGAGRVNVESAAGARALLSPVSVSFGATPSGSGATKSMAVTLLNGTKSTVDWTVGIAPYGGASGVKFTTSISSVKLAAGASTTFTVNAAFAKAAPSGDKQAWLVIGDAAGLVAHAAVYAFVK
jgi:hypothetical protein